MPQRSSPPVLARSFQALDQLAKRAVARAVAQHHSAGRSTWLMAEGQLVQQAPDGSRKPLEPEALASPRAPEDPPRRP